MKKYASLILALALGLALWSCHGQNTVMQTGQPENGALEALPSDTPTPSPTPTPAPTPTPEPTVATLAVCGDTMCHNTIVSAAWDGAAYDFTPLMAAAEPYVSRADFAVVNLETTLPGGTEFTGYPRFRTPDALAYDLKELGFDLALTANNHCMDAGFDGLSRTLDVLDEAGLAHVGASRTREEAENNIVVADVGGISVAFLGYTYGTNGIPLDSDAPWSVNLFNLDYMTGLSTPDTEKLLGDLEQAKALGADLIAVLIHWGVEYQTTQNSYQEEIADLLIGNGADIVLGGHAHVLQPSQTRTAVGADGVERTGFVCYSLGNFFADQSRQYTDLTVVLTLELTRDNATGDASVTDWSYVPLVMVDWGRGTAHDTRYELVDAYAALDEGGSGIEARLEQAISDIHDILGAEHDTRADGAG